MRGALTEKDGFTNVETDIDNRLATDYSKSKADLTAKLEELGKANEHIAGWSIK